MRELARDVRDVSNTFYLGDPALPARERAEADVATCASHLDADKTADVVAALSGVLNPLVVAAVGVCWAVQAEAANEEWARLLLDAHGQVEAAKAVAWATDAARLDALRKPVAARTEPVAAVSSRAMSSARS